MCLHSEYFKNSAMTDKGRKTAVVSKSVLLMEPWDNRDVNYEKLCIILICSNVQ